MFTAGCSARASGQVGLGGWGAADGRELPVASGVLCCGGRKELGDGSDVYDVILDRAHRVCCELSAASQYR